MTMYKFCKEKFIVDTPPACELNKGSQKCSRVL